MTTTEQTTTGVRPWEASIQASIKRSLTDTVEEIIYEPPTGFVRTIHAVFGYSPEFMVVLDRAARQTLLTELRAELQAPTAGTDTIGVGVFADLLEASLRTAPASSLFDGARFGGVTYDESRDVIFGHLGLGIDMAATIRDASGIISLEQHVVVSAPSTYRMLAQADLASLAKALTRYLETTPTADPLWRTVLTDAAADTAPTP